MRTKVFIVVALVATLALMVASPAFAGQQTRILYGLENYDVYEVTPASGGYMRVEVSWKGMDGTGTPLFPAQEVDGVIQTDDGTELYMDVDWVNLYLGTNPQVDTGAVVGGQKYYVSVAPFTGDAPYRLRCLYDTKSNGTFATVLLDTGAIDVSSPTQKWAYGVDGDVYVPSQGTWHSVLQYWPGTIGTSAATSDVYANWDDYVFGAADYATLVSNWAGLEYYPPVATDAAIGPVADALWYTVCPEIWTAAARPNVWNDYDFDAYPKPGSLAYNAAPLWYTYSFPDAAKSENTAYFLSAITTANASRHSVSNTSSSGAKINYGFYGTSVTWVYAKGPKGGIQRVFIDGAQVGTVDQYAGTVTFKQQTTYSGLANTAHTLTIDSSLSKNPASTGFFIYHDAFVAPNYAGDPSLLSENNMDGATTYAFGRVNNAGATGGHLSFDKSAQAPIAGTFNGTSVTWTYAKGPKGGIQRVLIDGVDKGTVDQYASSVSLGQTVTFAGLPAGWHTIFIRGAGTKNGASTGFFLYHDAFTSGATVIED